MNKTKSSQGAAQKALAPGGWDKFFERVDVLKNELDGTESRHAISVKIGQFLSKMVGRTVQIAVGDRTGTAKLCVVTGKHARQKKYFFEVSWDAASAEATEAANPTKKQKGTPVKEVTAPSVHEAAGDKTPALKKEEPKLPSTTGDAGGNQEEWDDE